MATCDAMKPAPPVMRIFPGWYVMERRWRFVSIDDAQLTFMRVIV